MTPRAERKPRLRVLVLATRLLRHRWRQATSLGAITSLLALLLSAGATVSANVRSAQIDSVLMSTGGYPYVVQAEGTADTKAVSRVQGAVAVSTVPGTSSSRGLSLPTSLRSYDVPGADEGRLVAGARPRRAGEAVVSSAVAHSLHLFPGSHLAVRATESGASRSVLVAGIAVDPGARASAFVDVLEPVDVSDATSWLLPSSPFEVRSLTARLQARTIAARTTEVLAADTFSASAVSGFVAAVGRARDGLLLGAVVLLTVLLLSMARACRSSVAALEAAGLVSRQCWSVVVVAGALVLLSGALIGVVLGTALVAAARSPLSGTFSQYWTPFDIPVAPLTTSVLVLVLVTPVLALASASAHLGRHSVRLRGLPRASPVLSAALVTAGVVGWVLLGQFPRNPLWAVVLSGPVVAGCYLLACRPVTTDHPSTVRRIASLGAAQLLPLTVVVVVTALTCGLYAAYASANTELARSTYTANQPPGSLAVLSVDDQTRQRLARDFDQLGGGDLAWYSIPDERTNQLRSTNPGLVTCLHRQPHRDVGDLLERCGPRTDTLMPVNTVVLTGSTSTTGARVVAAPGLIEGGAVGFLRFSAVDGTVVSSGIVPAEPGADLGENLPGAVVPAGSPAARTYGLVPSGGELLVAHGFSDMSVEHQLQFRNALVRMAPTAQVAEALPFDGGRLNRLANLVLSAGSLAVLALVAVGGLAFAASHLRLRQTLAELGTARRERLGLALRMCTPMLVAAAAALACLYVCAWFLSAHTLPPGWWALPGIVCVASPLVVAAMHSRLPA